MAVKEYDKDCPVTMASEPAVAYVASSTKVQNHGMSMDEYLDKVEVEMEAKGVTPPCQYTEDEVVQRVLQSTADVDAGRGLIAHEEFKKIVRSWYS